MGRIIGIDLGTTNSTAAVIIDGKPVVIPTSEGGRRCPSVVAVDPETGDCMVGQPAASRQAANPENAMHSVLRLIGRRFSDREVQRRLACQPCRVTAAPGDGCFVWMGGKPYSPSDIAAAIMGKLRRDAEARLGEPVHEAVLTVPAASTSRQREAIKAAGRTAGIEVLRVINSATAACLAHGFGKESDDVIAICDLGGGTLDAEVARLGEGVFEVHSTSGDVWLGGDDFDQRVLAWICERLSTDHGKGPHEDPMELQHLGAAAQRAKIELSAVTQTQVSIPRIADDLSGLTYLRMTLTRLELERMVADLVDRSILPLRQALSDARLRPEYIDRVVLVGGQTRMPMVQQKLRECLGPKPRLISSPDETVAIGAAIQAGVLGGDVRDVLPLDVTPLTLSVEVLGGVCEPVIERNTTFPTIRSRILSTSRDGQTSASIRVMRGEHPVVADNEAVCALSLDGILAAPRGVPQIEVVFEIDGDGVLHVTARDRATGRMVSADKFGVDSWQC